MLAGLARLCRLELLRRSVALLPRREPQLLGGGQGGSFRHGALRLPGFDLADLPLRLLESALQALPQLLGLPSAGLGAAQTTPQALHLCSLRLCRPHLRGHALVQQVTLLPKPLDLDVRIRDSLPGLCHHGTGCLGLDHGSLRLLRVPDLGQLPFGQIGAQLRSFFHSRNGIVCLQLSLLPSLLGLQLKSPRQVPGSLELRQELRRWHVSFSDEASRNLLMQLLQAVKELVAALALGGGDLDQADESQRARATHRLHPALHLFDEDCRKHLFEDRQFRSTDRHQSILGLDLQTLALAARLQPPDDGALGEIELQAKGPLDEDYVEALLGEVHLGRDDAFLHAVRQLLRSQCGTLADLRDVALQRGGRGLEPALELQAAAAAIALRAAALASLRRRRIPGTCRRRRHPDRGGSSIAAGGDREAPAPAPDRYRRGEGGWRS
mmetsp:Transcript_162111/g.519848  ORF Transcript_162111/g.519848 Transcript_162111/m.519848 type:complete len:439 (-) Transcript_162111:2-1318(-)